jgi:glycosyltransferase involved in cell wall biosynthesis
MKTNSEKIRKGIIIYYGEYPNNDSWSSRIKNTAKIFDKIYWDYKIVVPYPPKSEKDYLCSISTIERLQKCNKPIKNFAIDSYWYIRGIFKSYSYIKKQKHLDFVLFAGGSFIVCFPILLICKRKGIKVWIDLVDENSKKYEKNKSFRDLLAILNKDLFDKWVIPKFDKVLVISNYLLEKYKRNTPAEILYKSAPTLIDIEEFDKNAMRDIIHLSEELNKMIKDPRLKLIYAGSIVRPNGVFFALDCAAELINKLNYDFLIVIIVLIGNKEIILKHANKLGIGANVLILNKQDQSNMPAIYKQCNILILPEHGMIIANAGFPGKTAELLASGKPVIATFFSDLGNYLINYENAMISMIGNKVAYIQNLKSLLDNSELRKQIGMNGRQTAINKFDYRKNTWMYSNLV